jgi:hypothetical protein
MTRYRLALALCLIFFGHGTGALAAAQVKSPATGTVDVAVTRHGEPLSGLMKDEFELYVDGEKLPGTALILQAGPGETGGEKLAIIYHDSQFWDKNVLPEIARIGKTIGPWVERGNEVMVLQLDWISGLSVLQPFTSDAELIDQALERASRNIGTEKPLDDLWVGRPRVQDSVVDDLGFEERGVRAAYQDLERLRFEKAVGGILTAANMIKGLEGRKSILFLSDGLTDLSSPDVETVKRISSTEGFSRRDTLDAIHLRDRQQIGTIGIFDPLNLMERKRFETGDEVIRELIQFVNTLDLPIHTLVPSPLSKTLSAATTAVYVDGRDLELLKFREQESRKRVQTLRRISEDTGALWLSGSDKYERLQGLVNQAPAGTYRLTFSTKGRAAEAGNHRIRVKVKRDGADVRTKSGYRIYSREELGMLLLTSAYYNPSSFSDLDFDAGFLAFLNPAGRYEPWMSLSLPSSLFARYVDPAKEPENLVLHFWIRETGAREPRWGGKLEIDLGRDEADLQRYEWIPLHFKGPELPFDDLEYSVILALFDPLTNRIGAWEADFSPIMPDNGPPSLITRGFGMLVPAEATGGEDFSISAEDGGLILGDHKFYPRPSSRFSSWEEPAALVQIHLPSERIDILPRIRALQPGAPPVDIPWSLFRESWNEATGIWSGVFQLDVRAMYGGESAVRIEIPVPGQKDPLSGDLTMTRYRD